MYFILLLGLFIVLVIIYKTANFKEYIRRGKLISLLPGPEMSGVIKIMIYLMGDNVEIFKLPRKWSLQFYPIYKISIPFYSSINIIGPDDFEIIASSTKYIKKNVAYKFLSNWLGNGLLTSTGSLWQHRRKILTTSFHFNILQQYVKIFNEETNNLVNVFRNNCDKPYINILPHISQFTLYTINETSMGIKLNLENKEDKMYYSAVYDIGELIVYRLLRPWLYFNLIYEYFTKQVYEEKRLIKILHKFTNNIIENKSKNFKKIEIMENEEYNYSKRRRLAMLDLLLNAKIDGLIDNQGIQDEVNTFMFEGHDTTAMSICFTLMLVACHKNIQNLIYQEMNQVLGDSQSSPTLNDLQELKYMERCIKESLRLYPSVPFIGRELEEDVISSQGYVLPRGADVNIHIFDIHRLPKYWPDPEKFDPDRFLPENCVNRHPFCYVPFSAGPRNCIGQRYAILEIKAILCGILKNFILEPVDTPETIKLIPHIILKNDNGIMKVKFIPRK